MYSRMSCAATSGLTPVGAQQGRGRFMRPKRASSANMTRKRRPRLAAACLAFLTASRKPFFKGVLRRKIPLGMERTRHQLTPAMPMQQIVHRAVTGRVPDRLFVSRLEIVDVQQLAGSRSMGETRQQGLFLGHGHVLALASAVRPGLECLDAPVIVSHMRAVYCAQRNAHGRRNRRLRHPALAQQHHLDALSLLRRKLPSQRRLEPPDLGFTAFDHLLLPNQMVTANHISNPENNSPIDRILRQKIRRFMLFWSRY